MTGTKKGKPVADERRLFTVITPEGHEKVLGFYSSEKAASAAFTRMWPADWRALTSGVLDQGVRPIDAEIPPKHSTWAGWQPLTFHGNGTCEGCSSEDQGRRVRAGEKLCRSCYLLNEHLTREPDCPACKAGGASCPYVGGDA